MIVTNKPNPFQVLGLPVDATKKEIKERGEELSDLAETDELRLLYRWAVEQLFTNPRTRLEYELFEIPNAQYEDQQWEDFARAHRKNPVNLAVLVKSAPPARLEDFDLAALIRLFLDGVLTIPEADISVAIDGSPFLPGYGPPPLEVRDVIFG